MAELAAALPELAELRRAASSPNINRFTTAVATLVSRGRVVFAAALMAARRRALAPAGPPSAASDARLGGCVIRGVLMHEALCDLLALKFESFQVWRWEPRQFRRLQEQMSQVVASESGPMPCLPPDLPDGGGQEVFFPHAVGFFLAALASGWPWRTSLQAFETLSAGSFVQGGCSFLATGRTGLSGVWSRGNVHLSGDKVVAEVFLLDGAVALINATRPLITGSVPPPPRILDPCAGELAPILPSFLQLPVDEASGETVLPSTKVSIIVERRAAWHTLLFPLDGAAAAIVDGHLVYPRDNWDWVPLRRANHPSWENDRGAKNALGPTIAAWIHSGILEWVPPFCDPPLVIEPLGAVEKSSAPFYRLISDARRSNKCLGKWPVRCMNLKDMASALDYGAIMSGDDVNDAYHLAPFSGCTGELLYEPGLACDTNGVWKETLRAHVGCSPRSCLGTCDKARSGCCIDGQFFRFAATHFGQKLAGSPLNCLLMAVIRHMVRRSGSLSPSALLLCFLWVDDLILAWNVPYHGRCGGLAANCSKCQEALERFKELRSYWHDLADKLGISLSLSKRQPPSQRVEYTGVIVDTVAGRLFIPEKKLEKLRKCLSDLASAPDCSTRELLSVRGRLRHYSLCINYIEPLVPLLSVDGEDPDRLDERLPLPEAVRYSARLVLDLVERFASSGAALWPPVPSSLYGAFLRGDTAGLRLFILSWDSSPFGVGTVIRSCLRHDGYLIVTAFTPEDASTAQVHREALGGCVSLEAASRIVNLRGSTVLFRNDATGALSTFRKGNLKSPTLQALALRLTMLCADLEISPLFLHAPGQDLVSEGIDDASRRLSTAISGPACSPSLRNLVQRIAADKGWTISVDIFASERNRLVDRYFSEFAEPLSEAVDALSVTDWHSSVCPSCGCAHRENLFAFPPSILIRRFITKARADGARGVVIVPRAITASYWPRLLSASLPIDGQPYARLRNPRAMLEDADGFSSSELAIFAVDFSLGDTRRSDTCSPACGQEGAWRGRPVLGYPADVEDRIRIREQLVHLGPA